MKPIFIGRGNFCGPTGYAPPVSRTNEPIILTHETQQTKTK